MMVLLSLMEPPVPSRIGDRSTSDVVVRIRTHDGRDEWFYCHSHVLVEKSKYFAERLSETWPTCQILDSRNCVEVYCQEPDFNHHVNFLRLLYAADYSSDNVWCGVKNVLGILRVAVELGCPQIVTSCVKYLEAMPWEEAEEDEIIRIIPTLGSPADTILARLQPVNLSAVRNIFLSAIQFSTSSPSSSMSDLKTSTQEQLEYMLTEDDDAPLLTADDEIKSKVKECVKGLFTRFDNLVQELLSEPLEIIPEAEKMQLFQSHLLDLLWAFQILNKLEIARELVNSWVDASKEIVKVVEQGSLKAEMIETKLKVIKVAAKVLEMVGYGTVVLPAAKRLQLFKVWLPFIRVTKPLIDSVTTNCDDDTELRVDGEMWYTLESIFVSIILALPSEVQAEILTEWLESEHIGYPDFTEAFEVWCYRSKVARRRLADIQDNHCIGHNP